MFVFEVSMNVCSVSDLFVRVILGFGVIVNKVLNILFFGYFYSFFFLGFIVLDLRFVLLVFFFL